MPRLLDDGLLGEIERRWRERSPGLLDHLQPGIDDAAIDRISAPLGFDIPEEVRRWYRWNNGIVGVPIIFTRCFETLSSDMEQTVELQEDDENWPTGWLKVMDENPYLVFDCRGGHDQPVPVWHYGYSFDWNRPTRPVFDSIDDMVSFWIELIDDDLMYWDGRLWQIRDDRISEEAMQRLSGVPTD